MKPATVSVQEENKYIENEQRNTKVEWKIKQKNMTIQSYKVYKCTQTLQSLKGNSNTFCAKRVDVDVKLRRTFKLGNETWLAREFSEELIETWQVNNKQVLDDVR